MSTTVHIIWTLILMITVVGIYAWAWSSKRVVDFEEASRLPLDEGNKNPEEEKS